MGTARRPSPPIALAALLLAAAAGAPAACRGPARRPALIVVISVDQLPADLLARYEPLLSGGLRRLLDDGRSYTRAVHDHAITFTSPGHATLATGVVPARHGIVANAWSERAGEGWVWVRSEADSTERILGVPRRAGASPRQLRASALPDWMVAADPGARVVSLSGKRTTAIFMAGRTRGHVYWFDDDAGRFVTSSYYRERYPDWVARFNANGLPALFGDSVWVATVPDSARGRSRPDTVAYEGDGEHTFFPHRFRDERDASDAGLAAAFYDWWASTPLLDAATLALAREAVGALELGRRGSLDYLALGLSQLDRVGHRYGPLSREQLDALLRLDRDLGEFFELLDRTVGAGRYVVALSSDHGVAAMPEYLQEIGEAGRRVTREEIVAARRAAAEAGSSASSPDSSAERAAAALERFDFIADAMTSNELAGTAPADSFVELYRRSYYPARVTGVLGRLGVTVRLVEGAIAVVSNRTTHGSPYMYDRHVPLIFMGPGISAGSTAEPARTVDLAPTLARLAGVPVPAGLDGRPLFRAERP